MEQEVLNTYPKDDTRINEIKQKLAVVKNNFKQKWLTARKTKARFEENNAEWLRGTISLPMTGVLCICAKYVYSN